MIKEKIFLEINNYKINISIKEDNIYLEIESSNNNIIYYNEYSLTILKNNQILKKYNKIQEIYDFLYDVIKNTKNNILKIKESKSEIKFSINYKTKIKDEIITFVIDKKNEYEKKDDSIFKNNLNNFENILKEIENDMNNLDPYIKELKDENEIITEENIKLKKVIEVLKEENEKLKQELNNFHLDKKNSKDNFISTSENNKEEKIKDENKIKVERKAQKLNQEINNSDSNEKNSKDNFISKNKNNQERINIEGENIISKNENQQHKQKLNKSDSAKKIIKDNKSNSNNDNYILSKDLENKLINYIKESETYKDKIISFKLLYKASIDGDLASSFHKKVDNKGPILVIIKTTIENRIIGGFSSKPWSSKNKYIEDDKAFLFLFNDLIGKKFEIKPDNKDKACYHNKDEGPHFGTNALIVSNNCLKNKNSCATDTYKFIRLNLIRINGFSKFNIEDYEVYNVIFRK